MSLRVLTMDLEIKKNVLKNEYSIVIRTALYRGLSLIIICAETHVDKITVNARRLNSPHLFALSWLYKKCK